MAKASDSSPVSSLSNKLKQFPTRNIPKRDCSQKPRKERFGMKF